MRISKTTNRRRAAHAVEFAVIAPVLFMVLFGCFEWCRYVMCRNVTENAVREASRFSVARTDTLQTSVTSAIIQAQVTSRLARMGTQLTNVTVTVYKTNVYGQPTDQYGTVVATTGAAASFDQTQFGDYICVTVTGTYTPLLPNLLKMGSMTTVTASSIMCSEGN